MRAAIDYLIYVCAVLVIGVGALGAWDALAHQPAATMTDGGTLDSAEGGATGVLPPPQLGKLTMLLVGADERPQFDDAGRSDTMILFFLNPRTEQGAMLSIPRDLRVRIPGHGTRKINAAFALGGVELVQETIEQDFDVDVDFHAKADFGGFVEIVDMLGGVEVDVPDVEGGGRGMNYDDNADNLHIHLKPGRQVLDGEDAIGFVRYRKADSDFKRSERQHQFLKAVAEQKLKLRNIAQLIRIAPKVLQAIETDMSWRTAVDVARVLRKVRPDCLMSVSLQPYLRDIRINGIYYVEVSDSSVKRVLSEINEHLESRPGRMNLVEVLNGCGVHNAAADAGLALSQAGFEVLDTANADRFDYERTVIHHPADGLSAARRVQRTLGAGELVEIDGERQFSPDRITVVVGNDLDPSELRPAG